MQPIAILLAMISIVIWGTLALLASSTNQLPSLFVTGFAFLISGLISLVRVREWKIPLKTMALGFYGIFGYHFLLFSAFKLAPAVEVNLLNYLWPLLIVLLSPVILPGYRLKIFHIAGAFAGLCGVVIIVGGGGFTPNLSYAPGYLLALCAAVIWSSYSLMTKRVPPFPTSAVGLFCLVSGIFSLAIFFLQPGSTQVVAAIELKTWLLLALIGIGPLGIAFFTWDAAMKKGDPRIIGALSYLTPLLSTFNLVIFGNKELTIQSIVALILIIGGALLGSFDLLKSLVTPAAKIRPTE